MNIRLTIQYDGTAYHGYQIQPEDITIQGILEDEISKLVNEEIILVGCGRTDAGVHAINFTCNFKTNAKIEPSRYKYALNSRLPADIRCVNSQLADDSFHAKKSAVGKTYIYRICNDEYQNAFERNYSWHYKYPIDLEKMRIAADSLVGEHDFVGFASSGFSVKTTVRTISSIEIDKKDNIITIAVSGDGFLYNMVRIIAGTLVYAGCGKINPMDMPDIVASKDRTRAGITAPPQGLFLKEVYYTNE